MELKLNCIVIDDEPLAREGIADYVRQTDFLHLLGTFASAVEASSFLSQNKVDLIFLDIEMPRLNGVSFVQGLVNAPMIVFITAYPNFALTGYELNVLDYLIKPVSFERFFKAASKGLEKMKSSVPPTNSEADATDDYMFIKTDSKFLKIKFADIDYIEGLKDYTKIVCGQEKNLALANLKTMETNLSPSVFIRVHKSYIVSMSKITSVEGNIIHIGSTEIPIGKEYKEALFEKLINKKLIRR